MSTDNDADKPVAWLLIHPVYGEKASLVAITDGDRSLGWVDTRLYSEATVTALRGEVERLTRDEAAKHAMFLYEAEKHSEWLEKFMAMKAIAETSKAEVARLREAIEWHERLHALSALLEPKP